MHSRQMRMISPLKFELHIIEQGSIKVKVEDRKGADVHKQMIENTTPK